MCNLGQENEIDVIVALQPIAGFGAKPLTAQEMEFAQSGKDYENNLLIDSHKKYDAYTKNLEKLDSCNVSLNLRDIFDNESSPIYWDQGHVSDKGNNIIAKLLQKEIIQIFPNDLPQSTQSNENKDLNDSVTPIQFRYLFSNYKTPIMINSIFSFENNILNIVNEPKKIIDKPEKIIFETQSKIFNNEKISIEIEISKNNLESKTLQFKTINHTNNSNIPNVTYFIKIFKSTD